MADGAQQAGSPNRGPRYAGAVLGRPGGLQDGCRRCGVVWTALQVQQARSVSGPCTLACRPRTLSRPTPPGEGCSAPVPCPLPCFGLAPRHPPCTVSDRGPRPARRLAAYCSGDHGSSAFVAALGPRRRALDPTPPHCPRNRGKPKCVNAHVLEMTVCQPSPLAASWTLALAILEDDRSLVHVAVDPLVDLCGVAVAEVRPPAPKDGVDLFSE